MGPANRDIVQRVVDVSRVDADGIQREANTRRVAQARDEDQSQRADNLTQACEKHNLLGKRHPSGSYLQKIPRCSNMGDAHDQINDPQQDAEPDAFQAVLFHLRSTFDRNHIHRGGLARRV
jgi:hypothetical protein